ncbi:hypothetical protein DT603_09315 [Pseudoxanthomonas gei]|uniref:Uncharacterized protein n=1 Tax=Pseudoxanthomonas gei TaxID=1383030 RepID=A0ABX0AII1_9GAMM|nr:hypothetical protein [Pseudoxanthomonas gei]
MSTISDETRLAINKAGGAVFQKALAEVCLEESKAAFKLEGQSAVGEGFRGLGELAMTEMFADPAVDQELKHLINYIDLNKLVPIFLQPGVAPKNEGQL